MSIIQTIREKGAVITISLLAIALIGFMLMDSGKSGLFGGGNQTTLGIINGEKIDYQDFNKKVETLEKQYPNSGQRNQMMQSVWDQMVGEILLRDQFDKLGLTFTANELSSIMFSQDAPPQLKQAFTDPKTGQYDIEQAKQWWIQTKKNKDENQKNDLITQLIEPLRMNSLYTKYTSLIAGSIYEPKWLTQEIEEENTQFASISYVAIPYYTISDSAIKITDKDIQEYLNNHKKEYTQDGGRMVSYVVFKGSANSEDSSRIFQTLTELKPYFVSDTNPKFFLGKNSSNIAYFDGYTPASQMKMPYSDSILSLPVGQVFGPYEDGNNYVLAKKIATKMMPDSIKCRHILLGTINPQTQQPLMEDSTAQRLADSIATAIKGGASFDELEQKYSTDQAAKEKNGVMTFDVMTIQNDGFAKEFADFILNNEVGSKKVVKTQFGYHYIEVLEKKDPKPAYKIAYMSKEIAPSDKTINDANTAAVKLSGLATDVKSFNDYITKNGLNKVEVPTLLKENDFQLGGLQDARPIVRWAFEAKEGDVSEPFNVKDDYVVAVVTKIVKPGLPDINTVRPMVESILSNKKKAEVIKKKLNNPTTLEGAAKVFGLQVLNSGADSTLQFNSQIINGIGNEPKVAGAAFNKNLLNKVSPPIEGSTGVFVIQVNSVSKKPSLPANILEQQKNAQLQNMIQSALGQSFESLKKIADIKDMRSKIL